MPTWFDNHFIFVVKKISPILAILFCIIIYINRNGKLLVPSKGLKIVFYFNYIFFLIWFLKFPVYRFGSGILISTIVITFVLFLKNLNLVNFHKITKLIIPLLILLIFSKNTNRVIDKFQSNYFNNPWINIYSDNYEKKI